MPASPGDESSGALPEELRWGFRKWDDGLGMASCTVLEVGDVVRMLGV